ncbi:uncharacterized protein [Acropora muricata]|uniref:uncharacterized protein isoform X2 n=1 Tax=Acropora muricata TaxID=159855 RepID=UPI0034E3A32B
MKTFGLLGIFRRLLLLIFLSLAHVGKADETTVMMSREVNTRQSGFAYFVKEIFSRLNITALVKRVTGNILSCAFSCLNNLACFSFNFAAFPDEAGKFSCEILSSDKYNNSKDFLPSKNFHHFIIVMLVQQASWYMENRAITWLIHLCLNMDKFEEILSKLGSRPFRDKIRG